MERQPASEVHIQREMTRLSRFGANILDAHSCFILLPATVIEYFAESVRLGSPTIAQSYRDDVLELAGFHSLSNDVLPGCIIPRESGLIGWVAKHARAIHVSPFEHDSRTLGVYGHDQQLKSFIGVPITIEGAVLSSGPLTGVLACDSKKAFAFSKLQGKLLEELSLEATSILRLCLGNHSAAARCSWETFLARARQLQDALTLPCLEVLRIRIRNLADLETKLGTGRAISTVEQFDRLIQQALPPHFPLVQLAGGDFVLVVDNMMTSFYESKIGAIASHMANPAGRLQLEFFKRSSKDKRCREMSIEELITDSATRSGSEVIELQRGMEYEQRRA